MKKFFSIILSVLMILTFSMTALADGELFSYQDGRIVGSYESDGYVEIWVNGQIAGNDRIQVAAPAGEYTIEVYENFAPVYSQVLNAHEHVAEVLPGKAATCTEAGLTEGSKCSVCGEILAMQEEIPALGHKIVAVEGKDATCTEAGLTAGEKCEVCGEVVKAQEEIPALGHNFVEIPAVAPTCTESGATAGEKCERCGEVKVAPEEIPATGHVWDEGVITREATAEQPGEKTYTCAVCGETRTEEVAYVPTEPTEPTHYSIEKEGNIVSITLDENAEALEEPYVYVVWSYTLADGTNFSFTKTFEASSNGTFRIGNATTPLGATLDFVCVIVCDDLDLESKGVAEANAKDYGLAMFE